MIKKIQISQIQFHYTTMNGMLDLIVNNVEKKHKTFIVTANPEIVMYAKRNFEYLKTLQTADYIVPDGIGIIMGAKILNNPLPERISGIDLMTKLLTIANEKKLSVFFLGAKKDVIKNVVKNVNKDFPNLQICGYHHGYFDEDDPNIVKMVQQANPDLTFVALGFPKQEKWIGTHYHLFNKGIFMGVGGSFDVLAGKVKRAPQMWRQLNLEWLYRLIKQPSRLKRLSFLPLFMLDIFQEKFISQKRKWQYPSVVSNKTQSETFLKRFRRLYNPRIK